MLLDFVWVVVHNDTDYSEEEQTLNRRNISKFISLSCQPLYNEPKTTTYKSRLETLLHLYITCRVMLTTIKIPSP